ncbi:hypothetical protein [Austwickia sp. TVS 96-490-7B]|uniref:hypothetical protein n=1 Tax=Austwickia sp. TVS 96-490-7B TaxID=2830843 RepID=UPI001C55B703|nr:hypothetical protein [Austwickia sp. TVS 96-490-7B]
MPVDNQRVVQRAALLIQAGRYDSALACLDPALARSPQDVFLHRLACEACRCSGAAKRALEHAEVAISLAPDDPISHVDLAYSLRDVGDHEAAYRAAIEAVRLDPSDWLHHHAVAFTATDVPGAEEDALRAAAEAVRLAPHEPQAHLAAADARSALLDDPVRRAEALSHLEEALRLDPSNPNAQRAWTIVSAIGGDRTRSLSDVSATTPQEIAMINQAARDLVANALRARYRSDAFMMVFIAVLFVPSPEVSWFCAVVGCLRRFWIGNQDRGFLLGVLGPEDGPVMRRFRADEPILARGVDRLRWFQIAYVCCALLPPLLLIPALWVLIIRPWRGTSGVSIPVEGTTSEL